MAETALRGFPVTKTEISIPVVLDTVSAQYYIVEQSVASNKILFVFACLWCHHVCEQTVPVTQLMRSLVLLGISVPKKLEI